MISDAASKRPLRAGPGFLALLAFLAAMPSAAAEPVDAAKLAESVATAQKLVEEVRGVPFKGTVPSAFVAEKDLPKILSQKLVEDLPAPFERYAGSLVALGLIDPTPDLLNRLVRLYSRQVAGFYDPSERKFYIVPERGNEASIPELGLDTSGLVEEVLLTHELTHALQDRRLDLDKRIKGLKESTDALLALQAFLEGEAVVVMVEALMRRLPEETRDLISPNLVSELMTSAATAGGGVEGAEGVPEFFVKELLFPYAAGTAWVQKKREEGGWAAVDAAYQHLPETTSEILHPGRSTAARRRLNGEDVPGASDLPSGAKRLYGDTMGEWVLRALLERAGAGEDADRLAALRDDDRVLFFEFGKGHEHIGFIWSIRCASPSGAKQLAEGLSPIYAGRPQHARPLIVTHEDVVTVTRGLPLPAPTPVPRVSSRPAASARAEGR